MPKKPHAESCYGCRHRWYHETAIGEVTYDGPSGHVCDGHKKAVGNLKSFPFKTKQKCFGAKL